MWFTSVLLVAVLSGVWAQDFYEDRKTIQKPRAKLLPANIHNGQGRKINEYIFTVLHQYVFILKTEYISAQ